MLEMHVVWCVGSGKTVVVSKAMDSGKERKDWVNQLCI